MSNQNVTQQQVSSPMLPPQSTSPAVCSPQTSSPMGPPQIPSTMGPPASMSPGAAPSTPTIGTPPMNHGVQNMHHVYNAPPQGWLSNSVPYTHSNNYMPSHPSPGTSPGPSISMIPNNNSSNSVSYPSTTTASGGQVQESLRDLQKAISSLEEKGKTSDPRYGELMAMKAKYSTTYNVAGAPEPISSSTSSIPPTMSEGQRPPSSSALSPSQMYQLKAQVMSYRYFARNQAVPSHVCAIAQGRRPDQDPTRPINQSGIPNIPYPRHSTPPNMRPQYNGIGPSHTPPPVPLGSQPSTLPLQNSNPQRLPTPPISSSAPNCTPTSTPGQIFPTSNTNVGNQILQVSKGNRVTPVAKPQGIDPLLLLQERENRLAAHIVSRVDSLTKFPTDVPEVLNIKAQIELRALRLTNFQRQLRAEILGYSRRDNTLETAINIRAYKRTKRQGLKEARITEKLEKQHKLEAERKRRQKHQEYLTAILQHGRELKEFHRLNSQKLLKLNKAVLVYHQNAEREKQKERERIEKERLRRLMSEDEEGYRKLIDEKKDKRLAYLLQQTDEFISSLTEMVKTHKEEQKKKFKEDKKKMRLQRLNAREEVENNETGVRRIPVIDQVTGRILAGMDAPIEQNLEHFLAVNPGWEVLKLEESDTSEDEKEEESKEEENMPSKKKEEEPKEVLKKVEDDEYKHVSGEQNYYSIAHTIKEEVTEQPTNLINGLLKDYQVKGLEWMVSLYNNNLNGILADEMGLGKTIQTIGLITYLIETKRNNGPFLIIVPLSTMSNWVLEFDKWAPSVQVVAYKGSPQVRRVVQSQMRATKLNVLLTTYEYVIKDKIVLSKLRWKYMIIDEGHRMKNHHCKLTQTLNTNYNAPHRLLLTGTPLQNKLPELWALLNFLLPSIFKSCSTFEQWFNAPFATTGEKVELNEEETILIIRRLHKVLRPFLLRRLKKEVESQLPDKVEYIIKCELSGLQQVLYRSMQSKGVMLCESVKKGGNRNAKALMNTIMQLRKLCNHPFMFQHIEDSYCSHAGFPGGIVTGPDLYRSSGKFEVLDRILPKMKKTNHRVLLFCQMTQLMTILEDYLNFKGFKYLRLDGMTKSDDRGELLRMFNTKNSDYFLFLLSTRAGGLGLNLQSADTVVIFDSDWNPHQDLQAQDRAHRIGQTNEVRVLRLMTVNTVEERILAAARYKLNMDEKVIQAGMFDQKSTGSDRRQFLQAILSNDIEDEDENEAADDEQINQYIARSEEEFEEFQRIDFERKKTEKKPRLMAEDELPEWMLKDSESELEELDEDLLIGDRKARSRKGIDYTDSLTDGEWLRAIGAEDEEVNDEDDGASTRRKDKGKKWGHKDEEIEEPRGSKKRTRGGNNSDQKLDKKMQKLIINVINYTDRDGRVLSDPFMKLPPRKELPHYYEIIKKPMDIKKIQSKIDDGRYIDINEMEKDFSLLCHNAQAYNEENSIIHEDSIVMQSVFCTARERIEEEEEEDEATEDEMPEDEEEEDVSRQSKKRKKNQKEKSGGGRGRRRIKYTEDSDEDDACSSSTNRS